MCLVSLSFFSLHSLSLSLCLAGPARATGRGGGGGAKGLSFAKQCEKTNAD